MRSNIGSDMVSQSSEFATIVQVAITIGKPLLGTIATRSRPVFVAVSHILAFFGTLQRDHNVPNCEMKLITSITQTFSDTNQRFANSSNRTTFEELRWIVSV